MKTADWAILISLGSLAVALASFVWNVWSRFIYPKARVRVAIGKMRVVWAGEVDEPHLSLTATNHGPTDTTLYGVVMKTRSKMWQRWEFAYVNPIHNFPQRPWRGIGPFGGGLPKELPVGQTFSAHFPYNPRSFLRGPNLQIGFVDVFGVKHWANSKTLRSVLEEFRKDFPDAPPYDADERDEEDDG